MKHVLVLGAGLVSRPLVRYLLEQPEYTITMASRTVSKAKKIIHGHPQGKAVALNVTDDTRLEELIKDSQVVVSLLPYTYHVKVATLCINHSKHLVTTSYVSKEMQELDKQAQQRGVLLLNEFGLDPGIDHMSAMNIIHDIKHNKGRILSFRSTTGALPSHEANTNPFGYKFSWSPRGVLLASRNAAQWLEQSHIVNVPGKTLFEHYIIQDIPGVGSFENYPNRNSLPYKDIYGLTDAHTVYRGTFRMTGWCETLRTIAALGWLQDTAPKGFSGQTYGDFTRFFLGAGTKDDLAKAAARYLRLPPYATVIKRLEWLGLFSDQPLPTDRNTPLDYLNVLTLQKMTLGTQERDMVIMHHEFVAEYDTHKEYITSTLLEYGIPKGDSAVARTVALPAAIAVRMIAEETIKSTGVHIPVSPEIYEPILQELETLGIHFKEERQQL